MFSQIITIITQCASQAFTWFDGILGSIGTLGLNSPKVLIRAMIAAMLACRFILYPFLKGRVVSGIDSHDTMIRGFRTDAPAREDYTYDYMGRMILKS